MMKRWFEHFTNMIMVPTWKPEKGEENGLYSFRWGYARGATRAMADTGQISQRDRQWLLDLKACCDDNNALYDGFNNNWEV